MCAQQLINQVNEQESTIKSLVGGGGSTGAQPFASEASRVGAKRTRTNDEAAPPAGFSFMGAPKPSSTEAASTNTGGEAWNLFDSLIQGEARNIYY